MTATVYPSGLIALPLECPWPGPEAVVYLVGNIPILIIGPVLTPFPNTLPYPVATAKDGRRVVDMRPYVHIWRRYAWWPQAATKCECIQQKASLRLLLGAALGVPETLPPKPPAKPQPSVIAKGA